MPDVFSWSLSWKWEGEAPAEPTARARSGSAGASPSRQPPFRGRPLLNSLIAHCCEGAVPRFD